MLAGARGWVLLMDYNKRLRIKVKKSMGHNPFAPNCIIAELSDIDRKKVCEKCRNIMARPW